MSYYKLAEDLYRIQAGVEDDGDIFGAIFLNDDPGILIGSSGGKMFVKSLSSLIDDLNFTNNLRVYLPTVTFHEIKTAHLLNRKFPEITFHVHEGIAKEFEEPKEHYLEKRFLVENEELEKFNKRLPKQIQNVSRITKNSSFETAKTKILIVPFPGPHRGHTYIYSRNHKLLASGMILGRTSDPRTFYLDLTGSLFHYENALSFLEKARAEILAPVYDEPEFIKDLDSKVQQLKNVMKTERDNLFQICSLQWKTLKEIYSEYLNYYYGPFLTDPYTTLDVLKTRVKHQLGFLVEQKKLIENEESYRRK